MSSDGLFLIDPPNLALRFWPQGFFLIRLYLFGIDTASRVTARSSAATAALENAGISVGRARA